LGNIYRSDCSCGVEKTWTWRRKSGWSKEYSSAIESELGFSLSIGLASISPKITAKINKSVNISMDQEEEEQTKFNAPKYGKHEIAIYQLISLWNIKLIKDKKRFLRKPLHLEFKQSTYKIGESEYTETNNVYDHLSNCNCKDSDSYDGNVTLAINSGIINLPCKRLNNKIEIYEITNKLFSKGDLLKLEDLPIKVSRSLHTISEAKIITYGEKLPLCDTRELIDIFKKLMLIVTENISMQLNNGNIQNMVSSFEIAIRNILSFFLQSLKNILFDDEAKLMEAKQSLNRLREGDLFELSKYLSNLSLLPILLLLNS